MIRTYEGDGPDGRPQFTYDFTEDAEALASGEKVIVMPGEVGGSLVMADGTEYRPFDAYLLVGAHHLAEVCTAVHRHHHAQGRLADTPVPDDEYASVQAEHFAAHEQ